jgi:hypothetical protein
MQRDTFSWCSTSRKNRSQLLDQVLQNPKLRAEVEDLAREHTHRTINKTGFVIRGDLAVPPKEELYTTIYLLVQHPLDDVAADSVSRVRCLRRRDTNLVQVQCDSYHQCEQITSRRKAFSPVDSTPHPSAAVRRLLRNKLHVDQYCTKEQLRIRHSKWELFRQVQAKRPHPFFDGEQVYHYPAGSKDPILYTEQQAATSEEQLQHPQHQQHNQQQQPQQGRVALPIPASAPCDSTSPAATTTSAPTPPPSPATAPTDATSGSPVLAQASTSAGATVAAQAVVQPTTRGNVPSIQ